VSGVLREALKARRRTLILATAMVTRHQAGEAAVPC
jgi:hypothetical protein